ncbi:hypothetical protein D3C81_1792640 [compost metagenome]
MAKNAVTRKSLTVSGWGPHSIIFNTSSEWVRVSLRCIPVSNTSSISLIDTGVVHSSSIHGAGSPGWDIQRCVPRTANTGLAPPAPCIDRVYPSVTRAAWPSGCSEEARTIALDAKLSLAGVMPGK